jgi:5'-methylthioadenosine phosphorylase
MLGVIGGSGMYSMGSLTEVEERVIPTPFGTPSSPIVTGLVDGNRVAFLARHGIGHILPPHEVPYRANIYALKTLGVDRLVSISACGSLREDFAPGHIVIPDQLVDHTHNRARSFFETGLVAHVGVADPLCRDLSAELETAVESAGARLHRGGTFITIEGPRFSTKAESNLFRSWGMSIIGMTACPEAFLAREAEMCYSIMAHVTDYDVWHQSETPVSVEIVVQTLKRNAEIAQQAIRFLAKNLGSARSCACRSVLETARITDPSLIEPNVLKKLNPIVGRYYDRTG